MDVLKDFVQISIGILTWSAIPIAVTCWFIARLEEQDRISWEVYRLVCVSGVVWVGISILCLYWSENHYTWAKDRALMGLFIKIPFMWIYTPFFMRMTAGFLINHKLSKWYALSGIILDIIVILMLNYLQSLLGNQHI